MGKVQKTKRLDLADHEERLHAMPQGRRDRRSWVLSALVIFLSLLLIYFLRWLKPYPNF